MPNDAKLGLVAGIAIVLLIAVLFFRRDAQADATLPSSLPPRSVAPSLPPPPRSPAVGNPPIDGDVQPLPPLPDLPPTGET